MHDVGAHEPGEGESAVDSFVDAVSEAQDEESDQGDGDLSAHGVLAATEEVPDLEGLLDPAEE